MAKFKPGQSGNPGGVNKAFEGVAELARRYCPEMIRVLNRIAKDRKQPASARVSAASQLLDRGLGRAPSFSTTDVADFKRATDMSDDELIAIAQRGGIVLELPTASREAKSPADYPPVTPSQGATSPLKQYQ